MVATEEVKKTPDEFVSKMQIPNQAGSKPEKLCFKCCTCPAWNV
jgi:hypothetical protein